MPEKIQPSIQELLTPTGRKILLYPQEKKFRAKNKYIGLPLKSIDVATADHWLRQNKSEAIQSLFASASPALSFQGVGLSVELRYSSLKQERSDPQHSLAKLQPIIMGNKLGVNFVHYTGTGISALVPERTFAKAILNEVWQDHRVKPHHIEWAQNEFLNGQNFQRYEFFANNMHRPIMEICFIAAES